MLRRTHQIYTKSIINVLNEKITDIRRKKNQYIQIHG